MRERDELRIDRFSPSPSEEGTSREFANAGDTSVRPAGAEVAGWPARTGRWGQWTLRVAARCAGLLVLAIAMLAAPAASAARISIGVSVSFGPPALPIYSQPLCPGSGYIWTPGYWAWDADYGYFWVPGTWVLAPFPGALWTPGYWAYDDGVYVWYDGYWGPVVGYYGGIFYGFGYTGYGYQGGYWNGGRFYYNRSVNNIETRNIQTVYNKTVVNNVNVTRVSYYGGPGGTTVRPTGEQLAAARQRRSGPVSAQSEQIQTARSDPRQRAAENKGRPAVAATPRPGVFAGNHVIQASRAGAPYKPEPRAMPRSRPTAQPNAAEPPSPRGTGRSPEVTAPEPRRAQPPARTETSAPKRGQPAAPPQRRMTPPQSQPHGNVERPPVTRHSAPRAEKPQPEKQPRPAEKHGGGNGHKPEKPHGHG